MFVITIGPVGKKWGKAIKYGAIAVVLLLVALIAWQFISASRAPATLPSPDDVQAITGSVNTSASFWQRFAETLQRWFSGGF